MAGTDDTAAALGTHVELDLVDQAGVAESLSLDIVPDDEADFAHGLLGAGTPLARAIMGHRAGATLPYHLGDVVAVHLRRVGPRLSLPSADAAARRQDVVRRAVARSEALNDAVFGLAAGSKWGDYDPALIPPEPDEPGA